MTIKEKFIEKYVKCHITGDEAYAIFEKDVCLNFLNTKFFYDIFKECDVIFVSYATAASRIDNPVPYPAFGKNGIGVSFQKNVNNKKDVIILYSIFVADFSVLGKGNATKTLKWIIEIAQRHNITIILEPDQYGFTGSNNDIHFLTTSQLKLWYKRNGFNAVQGITDKWYELPPIKETDLDDEFKGNK